MARVHRPAVAGQFYPAHPGELARTLDELLSRVDAPALPDLVGVLSPHAGYSFSGAVAAVAHKTLVLSLPEPEGILILGPSHFVPFRGLAFPETDRYATPLGILDLPIEPVESLVHASFLVTRSEVPHLREHSVEVQIPFLQHLYGERLPPLLPAVVGTLMHEDLDELARVLVDLLDGWAVVVSSDLYHGYSVEEADRMDNETLRAIDHTDAHTFLDALLAGEVMACGGIPVALFKRMLELRGEHGFELLAHTNSAEVTGVYEGYVVGYAAGAWLEEEDEA